MTDIFNSNDYRRGFLDGQKDAEAGKDKNFRKMGMSAKFAIYGNKVLDTYIQGYNAGYQEAMRKSIAQKVVLEDALTSPSTKSAPSTTSTNVSYRSTRNYNPQTINKAQYSPSNSNNMTQSLQLQLEKLEQLEQFLCSTIEDLTERMKIYNDRVAALREEGLSIEIADNYEERYCNPDRQLLQRLTENMENADLQYIRRNIEKLHAQLEAAGS